MEGKEVDICSAEPAAVALKSLILYRNEATDESMLHDVLTVGMQRESQPYLNNNI